MADSLLPRTLRFQLLRVIIAALLPLLALAAWQVHIALADSRNLIASKLRANAWSVAERQRDPFIIAQHALSFAARNPAARAMGPGCSGVLVDALQGANGIMNFVRTDAQGRARCSALPFTPGQDLSRDAWWLERAGRRTLYLSSPQIGSVTQQPLHIMVLPLYSDSGEFQGTLSAGISIAALGEALRQQEASGAGAIFVTDRSGKPIVTGIRAKFDPIRQIASAQTVPLIVKARDGAKWTYVAAPLYRDQLFVVYAEPVESVTQTALWRMWPSLLLPLLALALSAVAIWFASQRLILDWLEELRMLTARFARGNFHGQLERFGNAPIEFTQFAADLHKMANAIDAQEKSLRAALAAQSALTKEVHHRVKNNLQIVTSLLTLQSARLTDAQAQAAVQQARTRIAALGLIHRLLYEGEGSDEQGKVAMQRLTQDLCAQLRSTYRRRTTIVLECQTDPLSLTADQAVPLTLFIVETVNNAFAHAFGPAESGHISVTITVAAERGTLRVADTGRGFSSGDTVAHMGLDLIHAFGEQAEGKVTIDSGATGTVATLEFPVKS